MVVVVGVGGDGVACDTTAALSRSGQPWLFRERDLRERGGEGEGLPDSGGWWLSDGGPRWRRADFSGKKQKRMLILFLLLLLLLLF